jgi:hypothetical protein
MDADQPLLLRDAAGAFGIDAAIGVELETGVRDAICVHDISPNQLTAEVEFAHSALLP